MSQDLWCRIARRRAKWAPPTMGPAEYNQTLSVNRALSVNDFLTGKGVSGSLAISGKGEADPRVPTPDEVMEQENRRVEIRIN